MFREQPIIQLPWEDTPGQKSSTNYGPPRPAPVAANPNAQAAYTLDQASGGSAGQSGQHFRQPDEQSGVTAKKVRYSIC